MIVVIPLYVLMPLSLKLLPPAPATVRLRFAPPMTLEIVMPPLLSIRMRLSVGLPSAIFIVFPLPVSLFCSVSKEGPAFRKITFGWPLTVAPFSVSVPAAVELLPIINWRLRTEVTSIAPIESDDVAILMPAVIVLPALLNWATSVDVHSAAAVFGVQFEFWYQAVEEPVVVQAMVEKKGWATAFSSGVKPRNSPAETTNSGIFPEAETTEHKAITAAKTTGGNNRWRTNIGEDFVTSWIGLLNL